MPENEITCKRCGKGGTPPRELTWGGEIGEAIKSSVCESCWSEWEELSIKIVNEYRLSMANAEHFALYVKHLREFLDLGEEASGEA